VKKHMQGGETNGSTMNTGPKKGEGLKESKDNRDGRGHRREEPLSLNSLGESA